MNVRGDILKKLKESLPKEKRRIYLPRDLDFDYDEKRLTITIHDRGIGYGYRDSKNKNHHLNMQDDGAAFEGWAIVIKTYWYWKKDEQYNIRLAVDCDLPNVEDVFLNKQYPKDFSLGHYGRFLYRAYKFREEFKWFELDDSIKNAVKQYVSLLKNVTNHLPDGDAGLNEHKEIRVEKAFSDHPEELAKIAGISGKVNRQLGVWLEAKDDSKYQFSTDSRSAIDLWNITGSTLNVFELKANKNIKVGIISELFFYTEYCSDFYGKDAIFEPRQPEDKLDRGYSDLYNAKIKDIDAYFLVDEYHPLVNDDTIKTLNKNKNKIKYTRLKEYDLKEMLLYTEAEIAEIIKNKNNKK